ncbi:MAG TPA: hypothetical protein VMY76_11915 [Gemmatimonadales bacterium]|nr:hypothetical protein [Gemmatimonadales bacterium]
MSTMELVNYAAWGLSIGLVAWMAYDTYQVETTYDQELLVSSVEGEIEKESFGDEITSTQRGVA